MPDKMIENISRMRSIQAAYKGYCTQNFYESRKGGQVICEVSDPSHLLPS